MPFTFTIQNNPNVGDTTNVSLTDGNSVTREYSYEAVEGDTATIVVAALNTLINADIYFTSALQGTYPGVGLEIDQVATVNYDLFTGEVTIDYASSSLSPAYTMVFDEPGNAFEDERSYQPEMMCCLGTLFITHKDGQLYTHDGTTYNNFYGVQYNSYIDAVFNDNVLIKKTFNTIGYKSNKIWTSPTNGNIYTDTFNSQTGLQQISQLIAADFESDIGENKYAGLLRDANSNADSRVGLLEGDYLNGGYIVIRFVYVGSEFSYLFAPYVIYSIYQRNF